LLLAGAGHVVRPRAEGVLLEIGPCGGGRPVWSARHPQLRAAAGRAAEALGLAEGGRRSRGVLISCVDERGITPRAHQADDTVVDAGSMDAALDFALGVVDALDAELSEAARAASRPA
jgi:hypothetical protein